MTDINPLHTNKFRFDIKRLDKVALFARNVSLPGMSLGSINNDTPFKTIPIAGDKLDFNELDIEFIVDENMENYLAVYDWLRGLGYAESYDEYKQLKEGDNGIYSDATLTILTSHSNPNVSITFQDIFPINIGDLEFVTENANPVTVTATFKFLKWEYSLEL